MHNRRQKRTYGARIEKKSHKETTLKPEGVATRRFTGSLKRIGERDGSSLKQRSGANTTEQISLKRMRGERWSGLWVQGRLGGDQNHSKSKPSEGKTHEETFR